MPQAISENQYQYWVKAPNFPQMLTKAVEHWEEEKKRRQAFYDFVTPDMKAEYINGQVVLHSPATRNHTRFRQYLSGILQFFTRFSGIGGEILDEKAMIELTKNSYEPDISFWGKEKAAHFTSNQMLFPAPDFIVEVLSKSTERNDRGIKMQDYAYHGVREYWLVDPKNYTIEQYVLPFSDATAYTHIRTYRIGEEIESKVMVGLCIAVAAVFDEKENQATLLKILKSE